MLREGKRDSGRFKARIYWPDNLNGIKMGLGAGYIIAIATSSV